MDKQDLRVKKTQRALSTALLTLLESSSFSKITVNDICSEAMVSRSAFYVHFQDKYDLLSFCMELLKHRLFEESEGAPIEQRIRSVLERVHENTRIFKNLMVSELDLEIMGMMQKSFTNDLKRIMDEKNVPQNRLPGPPEYLAVYYSSAITSTIMYWVSKNMALPIDDMVRFLCTLLPSFSVFKQQ